MKTTTGNKMLFMVHENMKKVNEYRDIDDPDMHPADKTWFHWMIDHGELVVCCGQSVWQIINEN